MFNSNERWLWIPGPRSARPGMTMEGVRARAPRVRNDGGGSAGAAPAPRNDDERFGPLLSAAGE